MNPGNLNLARDPFLNRRPVERLRRVLWGAGLVLLALNGSFYLDNRRDSTVLRGELRAAVAEIDSESEAILELRQTLSELGPQDQNSKVAFLNQRIAERTFPWGELFDNLGEILPENVRLRSLSPKVDRRTSRGRRATDDGSSRSVGLAISGAARTDDSLYELIDAFFRHPAFETPKLAHQRNQAGGNVTFSMNVNYLPAAAE